MQELFGYLTKNIHYPKDAEEQQIQGRVIATFVENRAELDAAIAKQRERYRQVIFQGNDDLLKAYAIYKAYTELTYDELKPFLSNRFR